ncbi:hypothetical protein ACHAWF_016743, partial [Thalassiosira exigua]
IDSVLDAALDELDGDGGGSTDNRADADAGAPRVGAGGPGGAPLGVPYSLAYLAERERRPPPASSPPSTSSSSRRRTPFGPEPPPLPPPPDAPLPPEDAALAASLEGMMQQFAKELGVEGGGEDVEKALDDAFRKMMVGDEAGGTSTSAAGQEGAPPGDGDSPPPSPPSAKSKMDTPRKGNASNGNASGEGGPDVDASIDRLLDGIHQASAAGPSLPPAPLPGMEDVDPAQFEKLGEEMMRSVMGAFEKMGSSDDGDDVVDGVMKQLLDKDLMYEPMKEVCLRFPKWLAENKERLGDEEYKKYGMQYTYFQKIVRVYETEPDNFPRLMELMQDIQEYGQPPAEIIKDLAPDLEFDAESGMPIMDPPGGMPGMPPGMPFRGNEQCRIS